MSFVFSLLIPLTVTTLFLLIFHSQITRTLGVVWTYRLWALVPLSCLAFIIPWPEQTVKILGEPTVKYFVVTSAEQLTQLRSAPQMFFDTTIAWLLVTMTLIGYFALSHYQFVKNLALLNLTSTQVSALQGSTQIPKSLDVCQSRQAHSPMLVGLFKLKLVLPIDFQKSYNQEQRALILQHEICHFDRNDIYWNLFAFLIVAVFWFHPLIWLAYFRFRRDQELSCDSLVLARKQVRSRVNYSKALLVTAEQAPLIAFAQLSFKKYGDKTIMFERINQIKLNTQATMKSAVAMSLVVVTMLSAVSYAGSGSMSMEQQKFRTPPAAKEKLAPIVRVDPQYPMKAFEEQIEGAVLLKFDVDITGEVMNVEVMNGEPAYVFDRAAIVALKQWKYKELANVSRNNLVQLDFILSENSSFESPALIEKIKVAQ
ncbi:M56 family metallopeptidase [Thalassotalea ganghwensis]